MKMIRTRGRVRPLAVVAVVALFAALFAATGTATASTFPAWGHKHKKCERELDIASEQDMVSFATFDEETFLGLHHPDAIAIQGDGLTFVGIDAIRDGFSGHFEDEAAVWEWTELERTVVGCKSAVVLFDTTYSLPEADLSFHQLTTVTWTRVHGEWLSIADQSTPLED